MSGGVRAIGIAAVVAVALLLSVGVVAAAWLPDYEVRVPVTLTGGSSGAQTNYQLNLSITHDSDMQADFDDLRFTKADGTTLVDAWLENKTDSTSAEVWVNFTTTPANGVDQTYYLYYGNSGASSDWDGDATFLFHDDFSGTSLDTAKWDSAFCTVVVSGGKVRLSAFQYDGGDRWHGGLLGKTLIDSPAAVEWRASNIVDNRHAYMGLGETQAYADSNDATAIAFYSPDKLLRYAQEGGSITEGALGAYNHGTYYNMRVDWISGASCRFYQNGVEQGSAITTNVPNEPMYAMVIGDAYTSYIPTVDVDWILIRKYAANPATSALGSEQYASDSILYNATLPYNHTISSDGSIQINRSATGSTDTNWTAAAASSDSFLILTGYDKTGDPAGEFTLSGGDLDWLQVTNLSGSTAYGMKTGGAIGEVQTTNAAGEANFTTDISAGSYEIVKASYMPADPTSLANSTGNFWVNHTWSAGSGNVTDSYNVSVNTTWHNSTTNAYWNNTPMSPHGWSNVTVYAFNSTGIGALSDGSISQDTRIPNNAITITNVSDVEDFVDRNLFIDCDATDADSDTPTFSCNRTDLFMDFSTVAGTGNWTMVTGLYYVDFGVSDGYGSTNNTTIEILVKAALTPPPDIRDGVFGFRNASIPDNDTIDRYKADDILTIESSLDWDGITSGAWGTYKVSVLYCYDVNRRSGLRMSCDGDYGSATYIATVTDNITTYMPDLKVDPYQAAVQFIAINLSNTTSTDKADFVNAVAQNISEQTDNKIKIVVLETISGLEAMYVEESPVIYKSLSTVSNWIDFEAVTLRGNSTKSRIYSSNESFMSDLSDYRTRIFSRMRNLHNTSDQYTETHSVKVIGGDLILFNSGAAKANKTVASAASGYYWDVWNDTLFNNTGGGTVGFWLDGESYTYVAREDSFEKIVIQNNNSSLLGSTPTITEDLRFYSNGSMTDSWLWAGDDTDIKVELWDPTYIKDNLFMIHYAWINASWISNYTLYDYIIIADKNSNEITNTINRSNNTYGYISVADYANTQSWIDDKKVEVDDWADNYSTNIFLDGIDFVVGGTNFSARMKVLADYIMNDKDKSLILNTYTAYSDFATYGDAVMKESCFARWDGNVDSPTYSYEDMDIEKDRADYYTSHNIPVLGMSFGDVEDFDKMAYCAAAFAVLYGFDGDNCYRYGQPNFQSQKDINIYDFGNMLESAYIETSATDWNRLYVAGRVHIDPVAHTWYIDDDKTVTNISVDIGLYSGAAGSGDRNIYLYANDLSTQHTIPYYPGTDPVGSWTERSAYLDADEHTEHGHYYVYFYTRPSTGGWNFLGKHETNLFHPGYHSWYDTTSEDLPYTITGQTWNGLGRDLNWMVNMTVNYTTTGYVDELVDRITQGTSSSVAGGTVTHTTVIESERDCEIPVWGLPVGSIIAHPGATTAVNNSTGTWIAIDVDLVDDADAGTITWNYTAVDGEDYGAVREFLSTGNYIYRYLMPHLSTHELRTSSDTPTPPDPTGLANSTGNFWINHTWSAGAGNVTDSFNISLNDVWNNGTAATSNNTTYSAHAWQNITIWAYNVSGSGTLSTGSTGQDTQIPNNAITITNTSDWSDDEGENVYVDYDSTDADGDTPTFYCNRTDLFSDFSTADGTGNWQTDYTDEGVYYVDFGVSDGWGSTDNYTMTITVISVESIPPDPTGIANTTGNFWINHTWSAGAGNVSDSYNISVNSVWHNATATPYRNNTGMSPHGWSNVTVYAYNSTGAGTLSAGNISQDSRIPNNPVTITNTSDWSGNVGANVHVNYTASDVDYTDTHTFSCNRTDLFTDFSTTNGTGNWTAVEGVYIVDFGVSDGWGSTDNYTMTITVSRPEPVISVISFTPATLLTNYTGLVNVSFGVSHNDSGLNLTSLAFLYGINYTITSNYNNSIRAPANEICAEMGGHGKILRGHNRNATPYLTWENNSTITGGDIYTWGGGDHNSTWITTNVINSTYTFINISENVNKVFPNMAYLGRSHIFEAEKTGFAISKSNSLITRMWDVEKLNGRTNNFYISMYFDTDIGATTPSDDIVIIWCNGSYDPLVDDYETCPFCDQLEAWNVTRWMDHEYVPHANASYAKPLVVNATPLLTPSPDVSNYIIFASNTVSAKPFYLNVTNTDPGITNRTFAQTETCWDWNVIASSVSAYAYTPSAFYTFVRDYEELEIQLYVAGNNSLWGASGIHNKSIGLSQYPVGPASFEYFNISCPIAGYTHDTMMDATYDSGYMHVGIQCPADPDGSVTHNLTLHYLNQTLVGIVNNTFTTTGSEDVEINFTTSTYYSTSDLYTLKCVSTDEQGSVATTWLDSYFTLAADGTQGWVMNDMLLFWGMNNIPNLYATVNNSSLISYDAGGDIYTMHVPFFKSKCNDTFRFNETVHLQSLNTEDVAYFRFSGSTIFDNATVHGWNTTTDTIAPDTDAYRGYLFSCCRTCGNITNCNLSYLGSDVYRQEGLNFANNPRDYLIYNTTLSHNSRGVIMEECVGVNISHCMVHDNVEAGIGVYFTNDTTVQYTNVLGNGRAGVRLYGAHNSTIQHNNVSNSGRHGLQLELSTNSTFNNITILNSGRSGVYQQANSHNTTITNLTLNGVGFGYDGIDMKCSSYLTIRDTTITDVQGSHPGNLTTGIDVNDCTDVTIDNVTFSDVWFCDIDCWNTSRVELTDCYGVSSIGFYLSISPYATIRNNTWVPSPASTARQGISLSTGCNYSTIADNTAGPAEDYAIMLWKTSHVTIENNSCTHNITGQDYTIGENCTNVTIRDPYDAANLVKVWDTATVKIENTDNQVFAEDSLNLTYAYPTNFTMTLSGVAQTFNLTQTDLTAIPASDRLLMWNTVDTGIISFNATNNTANPQAWFNVTKAAWQNTNITVYRDDVDYYNDTADANGFFPYHYTGGWSEHWFLFSPENLAPDKPSLVAPTNGATGQSTNPTLQVTVTDPDLDTMDVRFYQQGGSQIGSTQTGVASGGTASVVWAGRSYSSTYYWYAVADDGNATTQSDTWHFTTQSSGGSHAITINDCNNRNAPEGELIYNDFNYTNADPDAPVFTTNATEGSLDSGTGIFSWTTGAGDEGVYVWWFRVQNAYGNSDTCTVTFTVTHTDIGDPTNLQHTTGNFWVRHTWDAGIKTDTFNVSVNTTWHNGTTNEYWNNTPMPPHGWSNISLAGYNTTNNNISSFISEDTRIPNNPVTITNGSDWDGDTYDIVHVDFDSTDADSDTPTYSCSRMDLFTNFDTATGIGNWTASPSGIYTVDFGVTDGWGSTSNYSMRIAVGAGGIQTETKIPVSIFIALLALLFCLITYVYYAKSHISRIFTTLIAAWMAFMLSQMIVSGNVVRMVSALDSTDTWVHDTVAIQIPGLSYLLLFIAVIMSIFLVKFVIMFGLEVIREAQREDM